ncbi:MAG: Flp pilus assembly protein CpaB [Rhodospirillaceae bacterium]|nr:Flp pilus assembly protein CpaB [Rhodospirillales bacterium]
MRPIAVVLVVVAMVFAGLTAFVAMRWLDVQSSRKSDAQVTATLDVLVVARDVAAGTPLADEDLRYDAWPTAAATDRFVIRKPGEEPKTQFIGQVARRPLSEGEPFAPASSFKQEGVGVLAGVLKAGMRAVSVAISNASAVSGFVAPGDRVDVVMAADFQRADSESVGNGGPIVRYAAETILEDVKVLAIDQQMSRGKDGAAIQGKTATLEVTSKQAEVLTAAGMVGQLSLVLRGVGVEAAVPDQKPRVPFTSDTEASKAMQALMGGGPAKPKAAPRTGGGGSGVVINRAGDISNKSF